MNKESVLGSRAHACDLRVVSLLDTVQAASKYGEKNLREVDAKSFKKHDNVNVPGYL